MEPVGFHGPKEVDEFGAEILVRYPVIGRPPLLAGGDQATLTLVPEGNPVTLGLRTTVGGRGWVKLTEAMGPIPWPLTAPTCTMYRAPGTRLPKVRVVAVPLTQVPIRDEFGSE